MQKDELIQMHTLLCGMKNELIALQIVTAEAFIEYDTLGVSPVNVHRPKSDHRRAIFLLGKVLSSLRTHARPESNAALARRFAQLSGERPQMPKL